MSQLQIFTHNKQFQNIALTQLLTVFSSSLIIPVLPVYLKIQGFSESEIGLLMGVTAVGALVVRPWCGSLVDTRGSRPAILFGQALTGIGIAAYFWVITFIPLLIVRFFQGTAMAFYGTGAVTFASGVETPANTAGAISLYTVFTMVGAGIATSSAPLLFDAVGFYPLVGLGLITLVTAVGIMLGRARHIPPYASGERAPFLTVLKSKKVLAPTVCLFASNFAYMTTFTFVPLIALAKSISSYSIFFIAFMAAVVAARMGVHYLNSMASAEKIATVSNLLNALSVLILAIHTSAITMALSGILVGIGFGLIFPSLAVYVVQNSDPANKGTALSILSAAGDVGNALAASVLGVIAEFFGYSALFFAATVVVLVCTYHFYVSLVRNAPQPGGS